MRYAVRKCLTGLFWAVWGFSFILLVAQNHTAGWVPAWLLFLGGTLIALVVVLVPAIRSDRGLIHLLDIDSMPDPRVRLAMIDSLQKNGKLRVSPGRCDHSRSHAYFCLGEQTAALACAARAVAYYEVRRERSANYREARLQQMQLLLAFHRREEAQECYERLLREISLAHSREMRVFRAQLAMEDRDLPRLRECAAELRAGRDYQWLELSLAAADLAQGKWQEAAGRLQVLADSAYMADLYLRRLLLELQAGLPGQSLPGARPD